MRNAQLAFFAKDVQLEVRTFSIEEALSQPFEAFVTARSEAADLDLDAIVGHPAAFRLALLDGDLVDPLAYRIWSGVCSHAELVQVDQDGLSTYCMRIVPMLWRCTQRRNHRIFQHLTAPEIVHKLLADYGIDPDLRLDLASYPRHEYRVQYGETDFAFVSRMLEEAGISYRFEQVDPKGKGELPTMKLILTDRPADAAPRLAVPIVFAGDTQDRPAGPFCRQVKVSHQVRPGRFTIRDFDFRSNPDLELIASARVRVATEERYELYHYQPGAFLREPGRGGSESKVDEVLGKSMVASRLDGVRTGRRTLRFHTNVLELAPGVAFAMSGHPRSELGGKEGLLVTRLSVEGDVEQLTEIQAEAIVAGDPCRPALRTPKPRISGLQSAIVVGPKGEEIYTDRWGRVRVQFHWDREGKHDEHATCWVRVSQAWAGPGYGIQALPRIGHEVLVDFLDGDPDQPVIIGRVHNIACGMPYPLPDHKTKTVWKSSTTPGSGGSNEITFEDQKGDELVYVHAQRNLERRVEADELVAIGANKVTTVSANERRQISGHRQLLVRGNQVVSVHGAFATRADAGLQTQAGDSTGISCTEGKLVLTNGSASLVLDGPNLYLDAVASIQLSAGLSVTLGAKQVRIDGGPNVYINCGQAVPPAVVGLSVSKLLQSMKDQGVDASTGKADLLFDEGEPDAPGDLEENEKFEQLGDKPPLDKMPKKVKVPKQVNEQLKNVADMADGDKKAKSKLLDGKGYDALKKNVKKKLDAEESRLKKLRNELVEIFEKQRAHVDKLGDTLKKRFAKEFDGMKGSWAEVGAIFRGERGGFVDSVKALKGVFDTEVKRIKSLRTDLTDLFNSEKKQLDKFVGEWKGAYDDVKQTIDHFQQLVNNPQDAVLELLLGDEGAKEAKETYEKAKEAVEQVKDWLGMGGGSDDAAEAAANAAAAAGGSAPSAPTSPTVSTGQGPGSPTSPSGPTSPNAPSAPGSPSVQNAPSATSTPTAPEAPGPVQNPSVQSPSGQGAPPSLAQGKGHDLAKQGISRDLGHQPGPNAHELAKHASGGPQMQQMSHTGSLGPQVDRQAAAGLGRDLGAGQGSSGAYQQLSARTGGVDAETLAAAAGGGQAQAPFEPRVTGEAMARRGGLAASDVTSTVRPDGLSFLQTPSEGQLMVVPAQGAQQLGSVDLQSAVVDAQMAGQPVGDAVSQTLAQRGYAVYQRPWGDYAGDFVRVAQTQV